MHSLITFLSFIFCYIYAISCITVSLRHTAFSWRGEEPVANSQIAPPAVGEPDASAATPAPSSAAAAASSAPPKKEAAKKGKPAAPAAAVASNPNQVYIYILYPFIYMRQHSSK